MLSPVSTWMGGHKLLHHVPTQSFGMWFCWFGPVWPIRPVRPVRPVWSVRLVWSVRPVWPVRPVQPVWPVRPNWHMHYPHYPHCSIKDRVLLTKVFICQIGYYLRGGKIYVIYQDTLLLYLLCAPKLQLGPDLVFFDVTIGYYWFVLFYVAWLRHWE